MILTGLAPLKKYLHTMGLYYGIQDCRLCDWGIETAQEILYDCEAPTRRRQAILAVSLAESDDFLTQFGRDLLTLIRETGLFEST